MKIEATGENQNRKFILNADAVCGELDMRLSGYSLIRATADPCHINRIRKHGLIMENGNIKIFSPYKIYLCV